MALWRDLIPRLHRADDFESRLHLLDDYDNDTTFEESGTQRLSPSDWDRHRPSSSTPSTVKLPLSPSLVTTSPGSILGDGWTPSTVGTPVDKSSSSTSTPTSDSGELAASNHDDSQSTLFKTASVGCALLALNIIVFTAVLCQWRGLRRTRLADLQKYASRVGGGESGEIVLGMPCSSAANDDASDRVIATYTAGVHESAPPSPSEAATVLTSADCTCNNIAIDGGIVLTAPNSYYKHLPMTNHVTDYISQRTTSTV